MKKDKGDIYFVKGWQEFVKHHSLGEAEFLLFTYNGDMYFDVAIYEKNGCKKNYQSVGTSHQESACYFTSSFPFFKHEIKDYNVGTRCILVRCSSLIFRTIFPCTYKSIFLDLIKNFSLFLQLIPKAFSRIHLPMSRQTMILRNSKGICWSANMSLTSSNQLSLFGGWKAFSDDNSIKKGDVCIFELVEKNIMQVHIFK